MFDYDNVKTLYELPAILLGNTAHEFLTFENGKENREFFGTVTVLIPCYKKSSFVEDAVRSCANQTVETNIIVLLMDEESQKLKSKLEQYPNTKCICTDRMNVCKARTFLVGACSTEWFVFLDADDMLPKNYVEALSKKDGAIRYTLCKNHIRDIEYMLFKRPDESELTELLCYNNTCLMHKDVFYDIGYDEDLCDGGEDTDFTFRLLHSKKWHISYNTDIYYIYRFDSENQLTKDYKKFHDSLVRYYQKNSKDILTHVEVNERSFYVRSLLKNFSYEGLMKYYYRKTSQTRNYKRLVDLCAYTSYEKLIKEASEKNTRTVELKFGRVFTVEDLINKSNALPHFVEHEEMHPIDRLFYVLKNYKCIDIDVNCEKIKQVSNKDFLEWSKICIDSKSDIGVLTKMFTELKGGNQ